MNNSVTIYLFRTLTPEEATAIGLEDEPEEWDSELCRRNEARLRAIIPEGFSLENWVMEDE